MPFSSAVHHKLIEKIIKDNIYTELCTNVECANGARCSAGECICPESCPEPKDEPVCGTDAKTYPSECELQRAACDRDKAKLAALHVAFHGECGEKFAVAALSKINLYTHTYIYICICILSFNCNR